MFKRIIALSLICFLFLTTAQSANAGLFGKKNTEKKAKIQEEKKLENQTKKAKKYKQLNDYIHVLELNEEQNIKYKQIRHEEYELISPIIEKIKLKHEEMENLLHSDVSPVILGVERSVVRKEIKDYIDEIHNIKIQTEEKIEAILDEKQKKRYIKLKEDYNKEPEHKTPSRSMGSVQEHQDFVFTPCEGSKEVPACRVDDLIKK